MKLIGEAYRAYWQERMARGPAEAASDGDDVERQADHWWGALRKVIGEYEPTRVVEMGSGYGRILQRMRRQWPEAWLFGYDLSSAAIAGSWSDGRCLVLLANGHRIARADLYVTCTCLQHITDDVVLADTITALQMSARPGNRVAILENVAHPCVPHVRDMTVEQWMALFEGMVEWQAECVTDWRGQAHIALGGVWR